MSEREEIEVAAGEQAWDAAIEAAARECDRHAKFCRDEANKGGDFSHLMARAAEAEYNAARIRGLARKVKR